MFYLVTASIVMHNMMVHERIRNDERESENFYDVSDVHSNDCDSDEDNGSTDDRTSDLNQNVVGDFDKTNVRDNIRKYAIVQKRWNELYSEENSLRLQDAVKKFVFKKHFGDDGTLDSLEMAEDYDPLIY